MLVFRDARLKATLSNISRCAHCKSMEESVGDLAALQSLHEKNQTARDSALLTLGSATLGFTITIFSSVYNGQLIGLCVFSWGLLFVSMTCLLFSFGSAAACSDKILLFNMTKDAERQNHLYSRFRFYFKTTRRLNRAALGAYLVALSLFVMFAVANVLHPKPEEKMPTQKIELNVNLERGALPSAALIPTPPPLKPAVPTPQAVPPQPAGSKE